jgi:hypothetical protein
MSSKLCILIFDNELVSALRVYMVNTLVYRVVLRVSSSLLNTSGAGGPGYNPSAICAMWCMILPLKWCIILPMLASLKMMLRLSRTVGDFS